MLFDIEICFSSDSDLLKSLEIFTNLVKAEQNALINLSL